MTERRALAVWVPVTPAGHAIAYLARDNPQIAESALDEEWWRKSAAAPSQAAREVLWREHCALRIVAATLTWEVHDG